MAFETQSVNISTKKILGVSEFAVSTKVGIDTEKPLKKVLSIKALADTTASENVDTDFTAQGKTQVDIMYLSENDTLECVTGYAEWQNTTKVVGENLQAKVTAVEVTIDSANSTEVDISILHNMFVEGIYKQQIMPLTDFTEDYVCNYNSVMLNQINATNTGRFIVAENLEMPTAQKVLNIDACSKITNVYAGIDQVSIEGVVDVKIFYQTTEGTATLTKSLDYKQEVSCLSALPDNQAYASVNINSVNATLEVGEKTNLVLSIGLSAIVDAYTQKEVNLVTDLFSLTYDINTSTECVNYTNYNASKHYSDTVVCNVALDAENVDEIVSLVAPTVNVAQYTINNNRLFIEGVVKATLIYKNNQTEQTESLLVTCPFVSSTDTELTGNLDNLNVGANVSSVKIRSGKEVEVLLDLSIDVINTTENYFEYVKSVVETQEKQQSGSAITIYITKQDESLFNVAKALNVLPETITSQNEVVDGKFASGQRIFVYSPLNVEF